MYTYEEVLENVKIFVQEIAEGRIEGEVDSTASLLNEYSFSSIDIMDLLIKVRDAFFADNEDLDAGELLNDIYEAYETGAVSVKSVAESILKLLEC